MRSALLNTLVLSSLALALYPAPVSAKMQLVKNATQSAPEIAQRPGSFADLADHLLPAVVNISSTQKMPDPVEMPDIEGMPPIPGLPEGSPFEHFFEEFMDRKGPGMQMQPAASLGSGFIIDSEKGYIITNNHVIRDAEEVRVTLHDDQTLDAEIIGRDEKTDLAVLQVKTDKELTAVKFGDSDVMRVGDWILAIGNPFGLGGTVTAGIISARARDISAGPYDDFLQTDASINRGNSGGPMFNLDGEVIGINTAIFSPSGGSIGIGFSIPSALAEPIIKQLIEYGRTRRGWLGVRIQEVTEEIAESLGLDSARGAMVASITAGGPSEAAGLKPGDIILEVNGEKIEEMRELPRLVAETSIGTDAKVTYWRDDKLHTTSVKIGELEKAEEEGLLASGIEDNAADPVKPGKDIEKLGITLAKLSDELRTTYGIDQSVKGLLITAIDPTSEASRKGLFEGDVIVELNQSTVVSTSDVENIIKDAENAGRSSVLLLINRDGESRFIALKIEEKKESKKTEKTLNE